MAAPRFRQSDIERAIRGAEAAGLQVEAVEFAADGRMRLLTRRPTSGVASRVDVDWVDLAGETQDHGRA